MGSWLNDEITVIELSRYPWFLDKHLVIFIFHLLKSEAILLCRVLNSWSLGHCKGFLLNHWLASMWAPAVTGVGWLDFRINSNKEQGEFFKWDNDIWV